MSSDLGVKSSKNIPFSETSQKKRSEKNEDTRTYDIAKAALFTAVCGVVIYFAGSSFLRSFTIEKEKDLRYCAVLGNSLLLKTEDFSLKEVSEKPQDLAKGLCEFANHLSLSNNPWDPSSKKPICDLEDLKQIDSLKDLAEFGKNLSRQLLDFSTQNKSINFDFSTDAFIGLGPKPDQINLLDIEINGVRLVADPGTLIRHGAIREKGKLFDVISGTPSHIMNEIANSIEEVATNVLQAFETQCSFP